MPDFRPVIPGVFTMGNVVCGFFSILSTLEGNVTTAAWLVLLAALLDALDGKVARISGGSSRFGVELDSLADFLSFGVAPGVLVHALALGDLGRWGWLVAIVYIMAAAYRLARYNLLADTDEKRDFVGLPAPGAAFLLVSYVIFSFDIFGEIRFPELLVGMVVGSAVLMVSQVEYTAFPDRFTQRADRIKLLIVIIAAALILVWPRLMLFPLIAAYILFGLGRELTRLFGLGVERVTSRVTANRRSEHEDIQDE